ncbi:DUF4294 domain-containing protein [Petrimonas sp.]|jgi:hypothetical protein|uniref:DUF4294 domain-containing protein n=1 Tax=Petrimonas TaxID=307628 RepID=UPI000EBABA7D|nr:DUF4294 domain-containing protein [Petrimonas sp.]MEA5072124.1 DUF4294 domain-containing protein [Petrimonas sp.]NLU28548.1 DUF4294 domain-containing protein [Bacteroidales bacterium]HCF80547.1 DUF4294 domain-containing protein [Porphyromonadaceae bacterium]
MIRFVQIWLLLTVPLAFQAKAQDFFADNASPAKQRTTLYLLPNVYPAVVIDGDTVACMSLHDFIKYSPLRFGSNREQLQYTKLIRDVKKTLPYAKEIAVIITETYEYMETLPDDKARQSHLNQMEKYLMEAYTPKMKKLTRSQGQLLMKLVDRETNSSSYHIIDAYMGSAKAFFYNAFASMFGNSLKKRYNPYAEDRLTERACVLVEQGAF